MRTIFLLLALASIQVLYAQSAKCKYAYDQTDDFTKKRKVRTVEEYLFENKSASFLNNALFDENTNHEFYVCADYHGGNRSLLFTLSAEDDASSTEDYRLLELLLSNDSVVQLYRPSNEGHDFKETNLYWRFYAITSSQWALLKTNAVKKLRFHYEDNTIGDFDIKSKYANNISKVINCLDNLNLPVEADPKTGRSDSAEGEMANKSEPGKSKNTPVEEIKPLGNNNAVSMHKQWKVSALLDQNGIPKNNTSTQITRFFDNGTYTSWLKLPDGSINTSEGKYQLLNDDKIIVFTYADGKTFSGLITKLSNTELIIKSEQFTSIYTVY